MAFPTVVSATTHQFSAASTNHNVPMQSPSAGNLIVVCLATENGGTDQNTPADWTQLAIDDLAANNTGASGRLGIYIKVATGSEGTANVNFTTTASRTGCAHQYVISDWYGSLPDGIAVSSATIPQASDPASVSPSWGSADNLFFAVAAIFDDDLNYTNAPSNYGNLQNVVSGNGVAGTGAGLGSARRELAGSSDDPGVFTVETGTGTFEFCTTFVVRPAASAEATLTPAQGTITLSGNIPSITGAFNNVRIREVLVSSTGQPVGGAADITLLVWYSGIFRGAPDISLNGLTTDSLGTTSWSIATGSLVFQQPIAFLAQNAVSYSHYTAARMIPSYE